MTEPTAAQQWPHVRCQRTEAHEPHTHINEGPQGGCGLPEWCDGRPSAAHPQGCASERTARKADWATVLGKRVRVYDGQHASVRAEGEVIGVITAPTLCIRRADGSIAHESSDLPVEYAHEKWMPLR